MQLLCYLHPEMGRAFPNDKKPGDDPCTLSQVCFSLCFPGHNVGNLFHMADDLGRAMESLVSVMTDEEGAE